MKSRDVRALSVAVLALAAVAHAEPTHAQSLSLSEALDAAFDTHPSLSRANAMEAGAREDAHVARSTRLPSVGLQYGVNQFKEPMITTPIHGFDPTVVPPFDRTLLQGSLGLRYTVLDWGGRSAGVTGADAGVAIAGSGARATRMELIQRVAEAYLRVVSGRAVDDASEARVVALQEEVARTERGLAAGTVAEVQLLRASVALQDATADRTTTSAAVRLAERDLARIMGAEVDEVRGASLADPANDASAFSAPRLEAPPLPIESNPKLQQAAYRADAARARVSGQRATRLPRLELTGALMDYGTLDTDRVFEWQAGVQLSWSLFNGGARSASIRRAQADVMAAESEIAAVELEVEAMVDGATTAIEAADARVTALEASVTQWEELVRIEALSLQAGAGTQRDLLEAEAGLFRARAGRVEAHAEASLARIRLAAARGVLDRTWIAEFAGETQ